MLNDFDGLLQELGQSPQNVASSMELYELEFWSNDFLLFNYTLSFLKIKIALSRLTSVLNILDLNMILFRAEKIWIILYICVETVV